jgi:hypothetical protein
MKESRQVVRAELFQKHFVRMKLAQKHFTRRTLPGAPRGPIIETPKRSERRKLARAFAAGEWRKDYVSVPIVA